MSTIIITGFMATSDPIPAYGNVALAPSVMYDIASAIQEGRLPIYVNHDERHSLDFRVILTDVRQTKTGSLGVWVECEVDEEEWKKHVNLGGFSIAVISDLFEPDSKSIKPVLRIFADAGRFDDESYQGAVTQLQQYFAVGGGRLYQFSILPPAKVVIDFTIATLQAIPANLFASVIYDVLKAWFLKAKDTKQIEKIQESVFDFKVRNGDQSIDAQVKTCDAEIMKEALATFHDLVLPKPLGKGFEFDSKSKKWKKYR